MKYPFTLSLSLILGGAFVVLAAQAAHSKASHRNIDADDAYKNNCMRCHTALPQYSPRMNKTVIMHMKQAANIPGDEAEAILGYLNGAPASPAHPSNEPTTAPRTK
jgi:hypothetical protein